MARLRRFGNKLVNLETGEVKKYSRPNQFKKHKQQRLSMPFDDSAPGLKPWANHLLPKEARKKPETVKPAPLKKPVSREMAGYERKAVAAPKKKSGFFSFFESEKPKKKNKPKPVSRYAKKAGKKVAKWAFKKTIGSVRWY